MSREEDLFHAALQLTSDERAALLDRECASDELLRRRMEGLIASHQFGGSFLQRAPIDEDTARGATGPWQEGKAFGATHEGKGATIDRYKLLEKIGEGGFGVVYMAQQVTPVRRRAALKIIKVGMDTKQVIGRFEAERQALAMMDHPNIAKVLDAGSTETGRPYFVMELVRGQPITTFCDQNNLNTKDRLRLFSDVCRAIQHAHQKGIIHRDIKPTNVMVTSHEDQPVPKVIDFGVAKATQHRLTEKTIFTQYAQMIGTPTYMSPEQAKLSTDVDTRTDVYSLGVLLYELLAGSPPFDVRELLELGYDEMRRQICEVDPPTPSVRMSALKSVDLSTVAKQRQAAPEKLSRLVRGELDWIVMKSLEKDRRRRYSTAASFAEDIQRFLDGDAVQAAAPSAWYRLRKLAQRNRVAATTATMVALALVAGTVVSFLGLLEARRAQSRMQEAQEQLKDQFSITDSARQKAELNLYAAEINRGFTAYEDGDLNFARTLLKNHEAAYGDRFEWRLLDHMCATSDALHTFRDHSDRVTSVAVSRHGVIASASADKTFRLFDLNRREQLDHRIMDNEVVGVRFTPDGNVLAVIEQNRDVSFWIVDPLKEIRRLTSDQLGRGGGEFDVEFLDNATIAVKRGQLYTPVHIWNWRTPQIAPIEVEGAGGRFVSFSRAGDLMSVAGPAQRLTLWSKSSNGVFQESAQKPLAHARRVEESVFSPDGKYLASRDVIDVRVWDTVSLQEAQASNTAEEAAAILQTSAGCLTYSPDGRFLGVGTIGGNVEVWPGQAAWPSRERPLSILRGHSGRVSGIAYSHDGRFIVTGSDDHSVSIWPGQLPIVHGETIVDKDWIYEVDISRDGKFLAAGGFDGRVTVYECKTHEKVLDEKRHNLQVFNVVFSGSGEWLASCEGFWRASEEECLGWVSLINLADRDKSYYVPGLVDPDQVRAIDFAPHDNLLAIGDYRGVLRIWDADEHEQVVSRSTSSDVRNVRFSHDGRLLAVSTKAGIELRRADTLEFIASYGTASTRTIAFSPDGMTLAYRTGDAVQLLDVPDLREKGTLRGSTSQVWGVAFSPDGKSLVATELQGTIRIWNLETRRDVAVLPAHRRTTSGLAISSDGNMMATSGDDNLIRIWRTRPSTIQHGE